MLAKAGAVLAGVVILGAGTGIATIFSPVGVENKGLSVEPEQDFLRSLNVSAFEHSVVRFGIEAAEPLSFHLDVRQSRPDDHYLNGRGIVFMSALLVVNESVVPLEVVQYYLGDADLASIYAGDRETSVPIQPARATGGMEIAVDGEFPSGRSDLVVTAWGAPGTITLNVTGGADSVWGPVISGAATVVHHRDLATVGVSVEAWAGSIHMFSGKVEYQIHPGDVMLWMGDWREDELSPWTGGLTCTVHGDVCGHAAYHSGWKNATIKSEGSVSRDEHDWVIAAVLPTGLDPRYVYPDDL